MQNKSAFALVFVFAVSGISRGEQYTFVGARATGMAGAHAASVHDATAQWHNPAVLGFMSQSRADQPMAETNAVPAAVTVTNTVEAATAETNAMPEAEAVLPESESAADVEFNGSQAGPIPGPFGPMEPKPAATDEALFDLLDNNGLADKHFGWNLIDVGAGYSMSEDMGRYLDILTDIDFDNIDSFNTGDSAADQENVRNLVAMAGALSGIDEPGNFFYMDATAGTSMRIGHFAFGVRLFGETTAWVQELDTANLGLEQDLAAFITDIASVASADSGYPAGYTDPILSGTQRDAIKADLGIDDATVDYLDYQLGQLLADGTLKQSDVDNVADFLTELDLTGSSNIDSNTTSVAARGFAMTEVPFSYGRAINENLSVGITAKAMLGRVLGTRVWVFDEDNLDEAVESVSDTESDTVTFGLDLGALYRIKNFQFAAVAHNINRPTFDGYTDTLTVNGEQVDIVVPDVEIDPQVTLGAALIPSKRFSLEIKYDLLEAGTLLEGYDIQRLSVGGELDLWAVALRAGAYNNLAESDRDWVLTAGVGARIFGLRTDVAGAYSVGSEAEYDGNDIPAEARLHIGIGLAF